MFSLPVVIRCPGSGKLRGKGFNLAHTSRCCPTWWGSQGCERFGHIHSQEAERKACLGLLGSLLHPLQSQAPIPIPGMAPPTVRRTCHFNKHSQENPPGICPGTCIPGDGRSCQADNKQHIRHCSGCFYEGVCWRKLRYKLLALKKADGLSWDKWVSSIYSRWKWNKTDHLKARQGICQCIPSSLLPRAPASSCGTASIAAGTNPSNWITQPAPQL